MNTEDNQLPPIAVLIDADNISPTSIESIFKIVGKLGEPIVRRAYGMVSCFSGTEGWTKAQREYGIVARPQVSNVPHKNVADIALVIDAMSLLYKGACKGICIVSSDSDFAALAAIIREEGKAVYGIGEKKTPESFRQACTQFFMLNLSGAKKAESAPVPSTDNMQAKKGPSYICPRCGGKLSPSRTKSNQNCRMCDSCGGMTAKLSTLKKVFAEESLTELKERAKKHEQSGCVCPDCGSQMSILRVSTGNQRVEIDVCATCGAIWYDKDELEMLVPDDGLLLPTVSAGKAYRRDLCTALSADLRGGRLYTDNVSNFKNTLKNVYHVPVPDIQPIIGALQAQKVITVDSKTGHIKICK